MNDAAVAESRAVATTFPQMLLAFKSEIARALPQHLNGDRMARIALTAFRRNPTLEKCDPRSVFAAVIQASQLGLEPDTLGRSYLVPYKTRDGTYECQFIPGWKGLVDLMNRSKQGSVWTGGAFQGDEFDYQLGDKPQITHRPKGESDPKKLLYAYAVGWMKDAEWPVIEVWPNARIVRHRDKYNKVGGKHYSFQNWEMYARKVVLLQVLKYMPCSPELETAIALDHAAETGNQGITVNDAIDGTWAAVQPEYAGGQEQDQLEMPTSRAEESQRSEATAQAQATEAPTPSTSGAASSASDPQSEGVDKDTGEVTAAAGEHKANGPLASPNQIRVIEARLKHSTVTEAEVFKRFGFDLKGMPANRVNDVMQFIETKGAR